MIADVDMIESIKHTPQINNDSFRHPQFALAETKLYTRIGCVLLIGIISIIAVSYLAPSTPIWTAVNNILVSVVTSGVFALVSAFYISYFFIDPNDIALTSTLLPEDIGQALERIATNATDYKIFVRTGRHFRAEVLPMLVKRARENRHPIRVE